MKKIAIFIPNLKSGGAERVFVNLAHAFKKSGYEVDFILLKKEGALLEQLPEGVGIVDLNTHRIRSSFFPLLRFLKNNKPDALIAVMWPLTIVAWFACKISLSEATLIFSDHTTFSKSILFKNRIKRLSLLVTTRLIYPFADIRLAVSNGVALDLASISGIKQNNFTVIYNPISNFKPLVFSENKLWGNFSGKKILTVGSLKRAKNHLLLINAFSKLLKEVNVKLAIVGSGEMLQECQQLTQALGISDSVLFAGFCDNPLGWYKTADLFVLSSDYEGLPMVLLEAISIGLPVVSTDCPSGPSEILENGKYGKLVPVGDVDALAEAMLQSLQKEHDVEALKARAADFNVDKIAKQYLEAIFPEDVFPKEVFPNDRFSEKEIH